MTVEQIFNRVRSKLDDNALPYLWTEDDFVDYFNDVEQQIAEECLVISDFSTTTPTGISVLNWTIGGQVTEVQKLALHGSVILIENCVRQSDEVPLYKMPKNKLYRYMPTWRTTTADEPIAYNTDLERGYIYLLPKVITTGGIYMGVRRRPLTPITDTTDFASVSPEIPEFCHRHMVDGMLMHAYRKQDVETLDLNKATKHEKLFLDDLDAIRLYMIKQDHVNESIYAELGNN